jgi:Arc/MetJ-type ribon-helix-helix transcriptional regulator
MRFATSLAAGGCLFQVGPAANNKSLVLPDTPFSSPLHWDEGMTECPTMAKSKVAITLDSDLIERVDRLVKAERFPNRSQAIEIALAEKLDRLERGRLARECAKLNPKEERALADEGLPVDQQSWPEY